MKKVDVVILNYKVKDQTLKCIESVSKSDYKNVQIIVVDNDSHDGIGEDVRKIEDIIFIQNNINSGYSGGNNMGIQYALKDNADYIFVLNPDTTIEKNTISILVEKIEQYNAGIVCPKIYFSDSNKIWFAGKVFDKSNVLASHIGVNEIDRGQYDKDEIIEDITGGAFLATKELFEKIGLFDERFFLYYEDSDLAFKAIKAGFRIMYIHSAIVYHKNAQSTGLGTTLQDYYITRNRMLFAEKYLPLRTRFALLREALRNIRIPARRLALFDYLTRNLGKGNYSK